MEKSDIKTEEICDVWKTEFVEIKTELDEPIDEPGYENYDVVHIKHEEFARGQPKVEIVETTVQSESISAPGPEEGLHFIRNTSDKTFRCKFCSYSTKHMSCVKRHFYVHQGRKLNCHLCDYSSIRPDLLKKHVSRHEEKIYYGCKKCNFRTIYIEELREHRELHKDEPYRCNICDFTSLHTESVRSHMLQHTQEESFQCPMCSFATAFRSELIEHKKIHKVKTYKCNSCEFTSTEANDLKRHLATHKQEKQFKCAMCDFAGVTYWDLKRHKKAHGKGKYACNACDYRTSAPSLLEIHKKKRHYNRFEADNHEQSD